MPFREAWYRSGHREFGMTSPWGSKFLHMFAVFVFDALLLFGLKYRMLISCSDSIRRQRWVMRFERLMFWMLYAALFGVVLWTADWIWSRRHVFGTGRNASTNHFGGGKSMNSEWW